MPIQAIEGIAVAILRLWEWRFLEGFGEGCCLPRARLVSAMPGTVHRSVGLAGSAKIGNF